MNKVDAVKWLNNLKNDIGDARHSDLWHYTEAIDDAISVLNECEEIVHCKECRYRSSYGECFRFMVRFLLKRFNDRKRIKPDSYLCLSCKHYKPRKGECKKIKGFLGEDFAHGNVYSAICPEYEPGKYWQWLKR